MLIQVRRGYDNDCRAGNFWPVLCQCTNTCLKRRYLLDILGNGFFNVAFHLFIGRRRLLNQFSNLIVAFAYVRTAPIVQQR